jgi:flagellar motor switch protein FliN/FliY
MNNQFNDNDFDNLMSAGELGLPPFTPEPAPAPLEVPYQAPQQDLSFFGKIPVNVTLEVASTDIPLKDLMEVDTSSVIMLDKLAGEPLDVKVNGALFAKAEVVVMNGNYGLRILELTQTGLNGLTS